VDHLLFLIGLRSNKNRKRDGLEVAAVDSLADFISKLNSEDDALVVAEGPRDAKALHASGFEGEVFMLCHKQNVRTLAIKAAQFEKVILLVDNDAEGHRLAQRATKALAGIAKVDPFYRKLLIPASRGRIRHVEELRSFAEIRG